MTSAIAPEYETARAHAEEASEVAAFCWAVWNAVDHEGAAFQTISEEWVRNIASLDHLKSRLMASDTPLLVARVGGAVIGVAATRVDDDLLEIEELLVHPLAEHHGVGSRLVDAVVHQARRSRVHRIVADAADEAARRFFIHRGFEPTTGSVLERTV